PSTPTSPSAALSDPRLLSPRSLQVRSQPLGSFLRDMSALTEVPLEASDDIADEKITLLTHDEPLERSLEAVASLLDLRWTQRQGKLVLYRDLATQQREAARCEARREALLKALDDKVRRSTARMRQPPRERLADWKRLASRSAHAAPPARAALQQ